MIKSVIKTITNMDFNLNRSQNYAELKIKY